MKIFGFQISINRKLNQQENKLLNKELNTEYSFIRKSILFLKLMGGNLKSELDISVDSLHLFSNCFLWSFVLTQKVWKFCKSIEISFRR